MSDMNPEVKNLSHCGKPFDEKNIIKKGIMKPVAKSSHLTDNSLR